MTKYGDFISRKRQEYGERFDDHELVDKFVPYFNSGCRIKVDFYSGGEVYTTLTGTVGVTTGWRPAFILMRRKSDHGSPWILGANDKIVAVQNGREYMPL